MWWIALVVISATFLYFKIVNRNQFWTKKGIPQSTPLPIFGDKLRAIAHNESLADMVQRLYNVSSKDRYCGAYDFMSPALVLRDPELIKNILVRDFNHFTDHKRVIPEGSDPIWDRNLFFLTGQKWKDMRSVISPAFTGSKMKFLFDVMVKIAEQFVKYFEDNDKLPIPLEMKDAFARFANDMIANTVFGFETNSLCDRNSKFYNMAKRITDVSGLWLGIKLLGFFIFPKIYKVFKIKILSTEVSSFFYNIVKDNIKTRREQHINRPDMINLFMDARENHKLIHGIEITDEDVTAQALVFFFAGFESVSSLMCFMSYELAVHPEVQERLIGEINENLKEYGGNVSYDVIKNMKYLDMVLSETLRKWPITPFVNRVCTSPYTLTPKTNNEAPIEFKKNDIIFIPIYGLHRDPKHFPDPEKFDPERFNDENKSKITPYTYLPFGSGPRKCIGYRFALLEVKVLFFYLLSKFEIVTVEETPMSIQVCKKSLNMTPDHGLHLALKRRNNTN